MVTVKRYVKVMRERGSEGFYVRQARHSSASVLKGEVLERAQQLLDKGRSVPEVAGELKVLANTLHKAIRAGRLLKKESRTAPRGIKQQERAQSDRQPSAHGQRHHPFFRT